ncbi:equilibrative nucleotide transporter 8 isoform X1 [Tripterygium wilfordii]|uniref:Equilibrative nucleotide transporter 8 isoform X1 n=1 Tax=Tripterygium wilfordii TaxID=458696 RepID=A0A7J7D6S4_TRIWF|nr:equilibrative nucleotide transporter 8-like [Tripterygium wilfordii]KAF5741993.1 equilibrative nucleotide transporter 8 isoform X1 [Tripterygium wilfordii]
MKAILGDHPAEPRDTYRIAYIIHFLLGAGNLLPWNAFITAIDYFGNLYPNKNIEKVFSVAYMSSSVFVLVVVMSSGGWSKRLSYRLRMNLGFSLFVLSMMVAPFIDWVSKERWNGAYAVTVASVVFCGLADGLIGGSLIGSAGKLPKQYMQAVFAGTASSGVLVSLLRIITKASLPRTQQGLRTSAHFYLLISTIILLCCTLCCNLLYKLPVMQLHYKDLEDDSPYKKPTFFILARKIKWPAFGIMIIYVVTLSIFPGFLAENLSSKLLQDWYPVLLITTYNVADFIGKALTALYVVKSINKAAWGCIARLMFYPFFAACLHGPKWLGTEVPVVVLTFMLGLTNGYLTSVLMILTPKTVPASEAELCAIVMVVFLGVGLVLGSVLGWIWVI